MKKDQSQKNIPVGWQTISIGNLMTISRGGSPRPIDAYITDKEDGLNWLRIGDINPGAKYIYKTSQKIRKEGLPKTTLVNSGDFILSNSMSFGRPYIMKVDACIHDGWLAFREIKTGLIGKDFLYYLLSSEKIQNDFSSISAGSGVQNLKKDTVSTVAVKIPPISEQKRIVAVLETWDQVIEKLAEKIKVKKNIKKGLMQNLLTGKVRLGGFNGRWKTRRLGDVAKVIMGQSPSSAAYNERKEGLPLIQGNNDIKNRKTIDRIWTTEITKKIGHNEIIMTVRAPVGAVGVTFGEVCIGRGVCGIIPEKISKDFLLKFLEKHESSWKSLEQGSTFSAINGTDIRNLKINIPVSIEEQDKIGSILMSADKEIEAIEKKLSILKEQKKFLLNNLITGVLRTPEK